MKSPSEQKFRATRFLMNKVASGVILAAVTICLSTIAFAQATESGTEGVLDTTKQAGAASDPTHGDAGARTDVHSQILPPDAPAIPAEIEVEIQRRFNELRRDLLDDRANTIDWWLAATAIVLTFFGIVIALAGYQGFRRFQNLEAATQSYVELMKDRLDKDVQEVQEKVALVRTLTSEDAYNPDRTERVREAVHEVQQNPTSSPLDLAIANAVALQTVGQIDKAIEKWRSIASVAEGFNNELAARAWFSIGYLFQVGLSENE